MEYVNVYESPMGKIKLTADEIGLTGLCMEGQERCHDSAIECGDRPVFTEVKNWLDIYFSGREPEFMPAINMIGSAFQIMVWNILMKIPYGKTVTYGEIAKLIGKSRGIERMSAQAVGGAVGHNRIAIIIPCHRVVGANGSLTGYFGGIEKKHRLLELEGVLLAEQSCVDINRCGWHLESL